ncbi:hypothetical protein DPMN_161154 [Dreissena polymorpha]|uniref:Uncharacterized protein n=1 Tax=Dreissena polymorpha TaxID=45954 RepID=A0A9D4EMZ4_DREPO|nr:hypothetical protein DPMN_161154 [Dreissena polymorpha]
MWVCGHLLDDLSKIRKTNGGEGGFWGGEWWMVGFHDDLAKNVTSRVKLPPPPGCHVIQLTGTIFKLNSHIKETNVLTKFHENWAKNVTSRVFTCFHYIHNDIEKNAPPTGTHVFSPIWTISKLVRDRARN